MKRFKGTKGIICLAVICVLIVGYYYYLSNREPEQAPEEDVVVTEIQNVHEAVLNTTLTPANFRRKILDFVVETDEYSIGAGHRPAKFFKKNIK